MEQTANTKKKAPAWLILCIIALVAGGLLGATNLITHERIAQQEALAAEAARIAVMPLADSFDQMELTGTVSFPDLNGANVDYCYEALKGSEPVGHVLQVTVKGYGGDIAVTVGLDASGAVTGINVGGSNFAETAGLGAKTKEPAFTAQFTGMQPPIAVTKDGGEVDSVTGATKSSRAVSNAVNAASEYTYFSLRKEK